MPFPAEMEPWIKISSLRSHHSSPSSSHYLLLYIVITQSSISSMCMCCSCGACVGITRLQLPLLHCQFSLLWFLIPLLPTLSVYFEITHSPISHLLLSPHCHVPLFSGYRHLKPDKKSSDGSSEGSEERGEAVGQAKDQIPEWGENLSSPPITAVL